MININATTALATILTTLFALCFSPSQIKERRHKRRHKYPKKNKNKTKKLLLINRLERHKVTSRIPLSPLLTYTFHLFQIFPFNLSINLLPFLLLKIIFAKPLEILVLILPEIFCFEASVGIK